MMATKKLPLATNVWRTGTLSALYWARGNFGDQLKLVGSWERDGQGHFYLPAACVDLLTDAGIVAVTGTSPEGEPQFRVVNPGQRIGVIRREEASGDGKIRRVTEVVALDASGHRVNLPPQPRLQRPTPQDQQTAPASPVAPQAPASPTAPAATTPGPSVAPAQGAGEPAPGSVAAPDPSRAQRDWEELSERYAAALFIADRRLRELLGEVGPEVVQAGAATVLISADRLQLRLPPGTLDALRGLTNGDNDDLPF
jgi:hypothetical protein